jgi:Protein of unknown function (DUF3822)
MKYLQEISKNNRLAAIKAEEGMHIILQIQKEGILLCAIKAFNNEIAYTTFYEHINGGEDGSSVMNVIKDCEPIHTKSCIVGVDDTRFMILPNNYKEQSVAKAAFEYLHFIENNEILEFQYLAWQDYFGASIIKNSTKQIFSDWDATILFANTPISLLALYPQYLLPNTNQIFISCAKTNVIITLYKNGKLQLHQPYEMQSQDDVLYYLQLIMNRFSVQDSILYINGTEASNVLQVVNVYYANAQLQPMPNGFIYPAGINADQLLFLIPILSIAKYANH